MKYFLNVCRCIFLQLKYKEVYEKSKAQINMDPEAHEIRAAKEAYKNITNVSVYTEGVGNGHVCSLLITDKLDMSLFCFVLFFSLTTRRNMKPPKPSGSGQQTDPTS